ncbi:MAG: translation initiation factor IF-2 [Bacteroidetes bacterium]|jgi:translation initiation factor IF-2|nr:translation initiation factor IF-2 [Bacteroidota bacterium]
MATTKKKFKKVRLFKVLRELNVTEETIREYLDEHGYAEALVGKGLNASIKDEEAYMALLDAFAEDKEAASRVKELRAARRAEAEAEKADTEAPDEAEEPVAAEAEEAVAEDAAADEDEAEDAEAVVAEAEEVIAEAEEVPDEEQEPVVAEAEEAVAEDAVADEADAEDAEAVVAEAEEAVSEAPDEAEEPVAAEAEEAVAEDAVADDEAEAVVAEAEEADTEAPDEAEEPVAAEAEEAVAEEAVAEDDEDAEAPVIEADALDEEALKAIAGVQDDAEAVDLDDDEDDLDAEDESVLTADRYKLRGTRVLGKLDLSQLKDDKPKRKRKRKRKSTPASSDKSSKSKKERSSKKSSKRRRKGGRPEVDEEDVEQTLQETLRELEQGAQRVRQRRRRRRRARHAEERERERQEQEEQDETLRVTEFASTGELANLMGVGVNEVISTLFDAGMMVSINQRLDADTIQFVADEFDMDVEFITEFGVDDIDIEEDEPEDLIPRAPVVTVMGHVDHGKTSLLDYIRRENVVAGESGGITQHIGAYQVELGDSRNITFLDTPGHEAFTAMRARGAKVTDIVVLVVAANDSVMPQTIEAINHAKAAEVPVVVAINKMDLPEANAQKVMAELAEHNVLVEQYGGQVQSAQVSAMTGEGIDDLMEKMVLEAELLELKGNPDRNAVGVVIESRLDKGRGNVATVLIQNGTLSVGDPFVAGIHSGRVRALFDERDQRIEEVGPSEPALVLGLNGQPDVGDQFIVLDDESEARDIAQRRQQIHREQEMRRRKHVRLEDIGRRMALGEFSELNLIIKGDVGGSVEALADALLKLSTDEVAVNIVHSGVGAITESDVLLASASDAVIIGFQVRPTTGARHTAQREEIDIRTYSIIYNAIEEVRDAMEGLLSPEESEKILGDAEVRDIFKVPKAGTIAGCYVTDGRINRNDKVRLIRDGVVIYEGTISSLKRYKDDVREVQSGYECGLGIENFDDIKVGDQIESYQIVERKRSLEEVE